LRERRNLVFIGRSAVSETRTPCEIRYRQKEHHPSGDERDDASFDFCLVRPHASCIGNVANAQYAGLKPVLQKTQCGREPTPRGIAHGFALFSNDV